MKKNCTPGNHIGCKTYDAGVEILAKDFNSTPEKISSVIKEFPEFKSHGHCWAFYVQKILKSTELKERISLTLDEEKESDTA